jgi:hypothetical protein
MDEFNVDQRWSRDDGRVRGGSVEMFILPAWRELWMCVASLAVAHLGESHYRSYGIHSCYNISSSWSCTQLTLSDGGGVEKRTSGT